MPVSYTHLDVYKRQTVLHNGPAQWLASFLGRGSSQAIDCPLEEMCIRDRAETLRMLEGLISIYLPDYKYRDSALSQRLSGAADYPEHAAEAILEMVRQTGPASFDGDGMLQRGTIVRHLILPGHTRNSLSLIHI